MELNKAIQIVELELKEKRFNHSLRVAETAEELAKRFDAPVEKVKLAAILHDYAKQRPYDELKRWIVTTNLPKDLLDYHPELWHGPVGALLIERKYGVMDNEILGAIHTHTSGKANMNKVEKIIYLADYIEPGRDFNGLDKVREAAKRDLNYACWMVSRNTIQHLLNKEAALYPDSIHAYNDLTQKIKWRDK